MDHDEQRQDMPQDAPRPRPPVRNDRQAARTAVILVLVVAIGALSFGLGWGMRALASEDGSGATGPVLAGQGDGAPDFAILQDIYEILERDFVDPSRVDPEILREAAINGMLESLNDPHSLYISPEDLQRGAGDLEGTFEGIGAQVDQTEDGDIVIVAPFTGSPAEQAGIRAGDVVLEVDGESTAGWTIQDAVQRIRGPRGTEVTLTVEHENGEVEEVVIVRDEIVLDSVRGCPGGAATSLPDLACPLEDADGEPVRDVAYVQIIQFTSNTPEQLRQYLEGVDPDRYRGLIIDLRNNPGGLLTSTVDSADEFLDDGNILIEVDRDGEEQVFSANSGGAGVGLRIAILVNAGSASGSEVVAGALRDNDRAVLVGEQTFGKGTVNQLQELPDGGGLYVSVARWLTPDRTAIEGTGLEPDIKVPGPAPGEDPFFNEQFFAALEYLRGGQ